MCLRVWDFVRCNDAKQHSSDIEFTCAQVVGMRHPSGDYDYCARTPPIDGNHHLIRIISPDPLHIRCAEGCLDLILLCLPMSST